MTEFLNNNAKNASIGHKLFKFNYGYYAHVFFENNADFCS